MERSRFVLLTVILSCSGPKPESQDKVVGANRGPSTLRNLFLAWRINADSEIYVDAGLGSARVSGLG